MKIPTAVESIMSMLRVMKRKILKWEVPRQIALSFQCTHQLQTPARLSVSLLGASVIAFMPALFDLCVRVYMCASACTHWRA